jgi:hypothetical protein
MCPSWGTVGCGSGFGGSPRLCRIAALTSWLVIDGVPPWYRKIMQVAIRGVKAKISLGILPITPPLIMPRKIHRSAKKAGNVGGDDTISDISLKIAYSGFYEVWGLFKIPRVHQRIISIICGER